jgi:helicase
MEADGLVEADGGEHIRLSILGHACGQSPLTLESAMRLVQLLRQIDANALTPAGLMALVQALPEQDDDYTPLGRGRSEAGRPGEAAARFGWPITRALQRWARTDLIHYARCKRALILSEWIRGVPIEQIEEQFSPNPFARVGHGDVRGFADATRFYLGSASRIAAIVHAGAGPTEEEITSLLKQLDVGLPADAQELTDIPLNLVRGEYLALYSAGLRTVGDLRTLSQEKLIELLGKTRAKEISALTSTAEETLVA